MAQGLAVGRRTYPVTIQQATSSVGASRFPVESFTTLVELEWMARRSESQSEQLKAQHMTAPITTVWEMGYRADMDPDLLDVPKTRRLVYASRTYDIRSAIVIGERDAIELTTLAKAVSA